MAKRKDVETLIAEAGELLDAGDGEGALKRYFAALELDLNDARLHYNIGLIYKYRGAWKESFKYNKRATELAPKDEAAHWNLGIAATALRDWKTARAVWAGQGMPIALGDSPIDESFGTTPVRLNPDGEAEVVWARRLCPVRTRITSIPFPESEVAHGDIVLNDGAPMGYRRDSDGREKAVFNMLEMFELGKFSTYVIEVDAASVDDVARLATLCEKRELPCEDWAANVRLFCKACSEGRPHEQHDHEGPPKEWERQRRIAIAARNGKEVEAVLKAWRGKISDWGIALER